MKCLLLLFQSSQLSQSTLKLRRPPRDLSFGESSEAVPFQDAALGLVPTLSAESICLKDPLGV